MSLSDMSRITKDLWAHKVYGNLIKRKISSDVPFANTNKNDSHANPRLAIYSLGSFFFVLTS